MDLDKIRQEIDQIDEQMKQLFGKRMDLARQVAETKMRTGAAVYAPVRERQIIEARTMGDSKYLVQSRAFFRQMMEISRSYQYFMMAKQAKELADLPAGEGTAEISFCCGASDGQPVVFLHAAQMAGLEIKEFTVKEENEQLCCRLRLFGDFSSDFALGAVLQMLKENKTTVIVASWDCLQERQGGQE